MSINFKPKQQDTGMADMIKAIPFRLQQAIKYWLEAELRRNVVQNVVSPRYFKTHPTGNLANSFLTEVRMNGSVVSGEIFSKLIYAGIQNDGGVIKPVHRKALTVPLDAAKTPSGKVKQSAAIYRAKGQTVAFKGFIWLKKGKGKNQKLVPLFKFMQQVTIKGTHYFDDAVKSTIPLEDYITQRLGL